MDDRLTMVTEQIVARGLSDPLVLDAMRKVPRRAFVPEPYTSHAYEDRPLPIGHRQTISQPYIVALMTELAQVKPSSRVLEIGTGSGYQAAVLAEIGADVYTIEVVEPVGRAGQEALRNAGYSVHARIGDGYQGWPEAAPFDVILVTAAPNHVPQPLIDQLAEGGRLVLPVGFQGYQELTRLVRRGDSLETERSIGVSFVPMTGEAERTR